jgi:NADH:ubiquinone reductase (H+-translocating)
MNIVVVGGGFAGVKTALELAKRHIGKITLISDETYFLHHATLYATATGRNTAESVIPLNVIFADYPAVTVVHDKIVAFETDRKMVRGEKKQYGYGALVVALGSVTSFFNIKGMSEHAFGIKSLSEVRDFHDHIHEEVVNKKLDKEFFVIGAGPTGVELAGALQAYLHTLIKLHRLTRSKARVALVEAAPRILPRLSKTASKVVSKQLEKRGIRVLVNHKVQALKDDSITIEGKEVPTRTAVWTSGVANNPLFSAHRDQFTLAPNGRVIVNEYLEAAPNVYVIGDNNTVKHSGMAWPAFDQGAFVANHITRKITKSHLKPFVSRSAPCGIPIGDDWGYVEWHGVYAAGKTGYWIRRQMELYGYKQLVMPKLARQVWRAHDIPEIDA